MTDSNSFFRGIQFWKRVFGETLLVLVSLSLLTLLILICHLSLHTSDSLLLYLLVILVLACVRGLYPALLASFIAFFTFDYFFVPPIYGLGTAKFEDIFSLIIFLAVALLTGRLASSLRIHAVLARRREYEAQTLYEFARATNRESDMEQQMRIFVQSVAKVFASAGILDCMLLLPDSSGIVRQFGVAGQILERIPLLFDEVVATDWVLKQARPLDLYGNWSQTLAECLNSPRRQQNKMYMIRLLPLQTEKKVSGVLRLLIEEDAKHLLPGNTLGIGRHTPVAQQMFFSTFLEQAVIVLEQGRLREASIHLEVLQQTETQRSALFSSVSHDLRTPLATIRTAATQFLHENEQETYNIHTALALTIEQEVNRLDGWIENVLDMSRLEAGNLRLEKVWYSLDELVQDAVGRTQFVQSKREIRIECSADLPPIELDPVQIEQVMINLLDNALHYTPQDSPIDVSIQCLEEHIMVSVADRGPGIPCSEQEHIFEKFYRLSDSDVTRLRPKGLGFGLAICRGIIDAHAGKIWVEERPGGGALFCFTLPLSPLQESDIDG